MAGVAVIGGGIVGSAVACALQARGFEVTLIDGAEARQRASWGNAGFLATELIDPLATMTNLRAAPGLWWRSNGALSLPPAYLPRLTPWLWRFLRSAGAGRVQRSRLGLAGLNRRAVAAWLRLLRPYGLTRLIEQCGYLLTWETPTARAAARRHAAHLAQWDIECRLIEPAEIRAREPALTHRISHALYFPQAYRVADPQTLLESLHVALCARGGAWVTETVRAVESAAGHVACRCDDGERRFQQIVICAGAWSHRLLAPLGVRVPLEAERGYHLTFDRSAPRLTHAVGSAERHVVLNELDSGLRIVGFSELGGLGRPPNSRCFDALATHIHGLLAAGDSLGAPAGRWMGLRPSLPDSLPVLGGCPGQPRVFCAFGHQHLGVTQAAVSAELVSAAMAGERPAIDLTPYSPARFA